MSSGSDPTSIGHGWWVLVSPLSFWSCSKYRHDSPRIVVSNRIATMVDSITPSNRTMMTTMKVMCRYTSDTRRIVGSVLLRVAVDRDESCHCWWWWWCKCRHDFEWQVVGGRTLLLLDGDFRHDVSLGFPEYRHYDSHHSQGCRTR